MEVENLVMDEISVRIELRKNSMQKGARKKERQFFNDFSQKKKEKFNVDFPSFCEIFHLLFSHCWNLSIVYIYQLFYYIINSNYLSI